MKEGKVVSVIASTCMLTLETGILKKVKLVLIGVTDVLKIRLCMYIFLVHFSLSFFQFKKRASFLIFFTLYNKFQNDLQQNKDSVSIFLSIPKAVSLIESL